MDNTEFFKLCMALPSDVLREMGTAVERLTPTELERQQHAAYTFGGATPEQEVVVTNIWQTLCAEELHNPRPAEVDIMS